jgi:hypothetical protein
MLSVGNHDITILKVSVTESKLIPGQAIYSITMDDNEFYGKPELTLRVGNTYRFEIDTPQFPFYITSNSSGGGTKNTPPESMIGVIQINAENNEALSNIGIVKGVLVWTPELIHTEMDLYYQCNYFPDMGNNLRVTIN